MRLGEGGSRTMTGPLAYLSRLCRRWAGELLLVTGAEFSDLNGRLDSSVHPLDHHAIAKRERLVFVESAFANPGTIIHEMGHVFLDDTELDERDWLGWEIALARRARCVRIWSAQNAGYQVGDFEDLPWPVWSDLTRDEKRRLVADRIAHARKIGILSPNGVPLCTRRA